MYLSILPIFRLYRGLRPANLLLTRMMTQYKGLFAAVNSPMNTEQYVILISSKLIVQSIVRNNQSV